MVQHQQLDTGAESLDVEIFHIPGEGRFAAFANAATVTGSSSTSAIFKWVDGKFQIYQRLETKSAQSWEFFEIKNQVGISFDVLSPLSLSVSVSLSLSLSVCVYVCVCFIQMQA